MYQIRTQLKIKNMEDRILGLHHITAIASDAQLNYDFYTKVLGLRLVKKTVNFDDPGTYHLYYGNENGTPGTILTFFPWGGEKGAGRTGAGMATQIGYAVPQGSLAYWQERFTALNVPHDAPAERFGEQYLSFRDPDGLQLELVVPKQADNRLPWATPEVPAAMATKGFHHITLTLRKTEATAAILTDIFGYRLLEQEGNRYRYGTDAIENAAIVDLLEEPGAGTGYGAAGTNHHVAFRVKDETVLMAFREKIESKGFHITPKIDRNYFFSLYFREPGGVLFELATDNPGFDVDEPVDTLGTALKLPAQYESIRTKIEGVLPPLQ
jgi:glyoxalase family protein